MTLKLYQVGGSVRDTLLNRPFTEKDWLVVGSNKAKMLELGYKPVGKHFPVFLHPQTKEEYALARQERKVGEGHGGFEFDFNESTTIQHDLIRRDITINALAVEADQPITIENIIDLHHGIADLENRILRHISAAFSQDPLRLYRVARFAAQLGEYGFTVAEETMQLLKQIATENEPLSSERIWMETHKAMSSDSPWLYWEVLRQCGALKNKFPQFLKAYDTRIARLKMACAANLSATQKFTAMHLPEVDKNILNGVPNIAKLNGIVNFYLQHTVQDNVCITLTPHTRSQQANEWLKTRHDVLETLHISTAAAPELVALALDIVTVLDNSKVSRNDEPLATYMKIISSVDKQDILILQKTAAAYLTWREILPDTFDKVYEQIKTHSAHQTTLSQFDFMQLLKWRVVMTVLERDLI